MNEAPFSMNFRLFPPSGGEAEQFTVRSEVGSADLLTQVELLKARLESSGYSTKPGAGNQQRRVELEGVVVGQYQDSRTKEWQRCLHFYPVGGAQFKAGTIYPENFKIVPRWVMDTINAAKTRAKDDAPEKKKAEDQGVYIKLGRPLTGVLQMRLNANNEPILSEKTGKPTYRLTTFISPEVEGAVSNVPDISEDVGF